MVQSGSNAYLFGYSQTTGAPEVNVWGAVVIGASVVAVLCYLLLYAIRKARATARIMSPTAAGTFRLAAARGEIGKLELLSRVPQFDIDASILGFTALHAAAVQGQADAICWLVQHGADVKKTKEDAWNDSALHYAAASGRLPAVQALLAAGCDPAAKNYAGATPADVAARKGKNAVAVYLTNVVSGTQPSPSRAELIDNRAFAWSEGGLDSSSIAVDVLGKDGKAAAPANQISLTASANGHAAAAQPQAAPVSQAIVKASPEVQKAAKLIAGRKFYGLGTQGTVPKFTLPLFHVLAVLQTMGGSAYLIWRALRSLTPGYGYIFSVTVWLFEFIGMCFSLPFQVGLWKQIERPTRYLDTMFKEDDFPHVDVFICCYSEPPEIIEPTAIAAVNMNYPGAKLHVHVLDDGKNAKISAMTNKLGCQMRYMGRQASLHYVARDKVKGVPHHAKAGNINSAMLKEGPGQGEYILILDSDMLVHPDFLLRTLGHFYEPAQPQSKEWVRKDKCAFIQTPQDFWNVAAGDPLSHSVRFFYGPMLQGRDGIGACPCCGTGVVFARDILASMGGQSYGSITEDYNTAMNLMAAGFSSMYLNERLMFGMAPDEISSLWAQRLRWTMGSLQILFRSNPLRLPGLSSIQAYLFFDSVFGPLMAIPTLLLAFIPIIYVFAEYSPCVAPRMYEFVAAFSGYYLFNRLMMWWVHRGCEGSDHELWRGCQMWVWLCPNYLLAIYKVVSTEVPLFRWLTRKEIGFKVTKKDKDEKSAWKEFRATLRCVWPHVTYYVLFIAASVFFVVRSAVGYYSLWRAMLTLVALAWGVLLLLCLWPPITMLIPREETDSGWRVRWVPFSLRPDPAKRSPPDASVHASTQRARITGVTPRKPSLFGMRTPKTAGSLSAASRAPSLFTGLPEVDAATQEVVQQLASQPFTWNKREESPLEAARKSLALSGHEKVPTTQQAAVEKQASVHAEAVRELSEAQAEGRNVNAMLPNVQALTLSQQQRALSQHRRLPSLSEHQQGGVNEQGLGDKWLEFQPDPYNTGMIGLPSHRNNMLHNSAMLTGFVLPERADSASQPVVLLEADGSFAPAPATMPGQKRPAYRVSTPRAGATGAFGTQPEDASKGRKSMSDRVTHLISGPKTSADASVAAPGSARGQASLERLGSAFVIPTEPASIYEHTIMARPNFGNRHQPADNHMFIIVHLLMLAAGIVGSVIDAKHHPVLPVTGSRS